MIIIINYTMYIYYDYNMYYYYYYYYWTGRTQASGPQAAGRPQLDDSEEKAC